MNKNFIKKIYYNGLIAIGADQRVIRKLKSLRKVAVLNFHRISPVENPFWPPLHPQIFDELLCFLKKEFEVCLFGQLGEYEKSDKPIAILSFDDGYYDFIEYGLPILEKHGLKANMNIIPQCAESGEAIWNVQLYDFLNGAPRKLINEVKLPDFEAVLSGDSHEAKLKYGLNISNYLKKRPRSQRQIIWSVIEPYMQKANFNRTRVAMTNEIKQISLSTEIGVHSFSHESMGFEENEFFEYDFARCREYFQQKLEVPMTVYAFPNGSYRAEQVDFLLRNNIERVLLVDEKFADFNSDVITRITIYGDTRQEVIMRSLGF